MKRKLSGFTLIELLVVIAIISILAAIVIIATRSSVDKAKDVQVRTDIGLLARVLASYSIDNGQYPLSNNDAHSVEALVYNFPTYISDTAKKLIEGNYTNKIPINERTKRPYRYWSDGNIFNLKGYLLSQPLVFYEAYTTYDNSNIRFREVSIDVNAQLGWTEIDKQVWVSQVIQNDDGTVSIILNWRSVSGYNTPFEYKVRYREYGQSDWVYETDQVYTTEVGINNLEITNLDGTDKEWDFQVVAYDAAGQNTEDVAGNPTLLRANFSAGIFPRASDPRDHILFNVCTQAQNCNDLKYFAGLGVSAVENEVKMRTNTIYCQNCNSGGHDENSTDIWGVKAAYRLAATNDNWKYVGQQLDPSKYENGDQPLMINFYVPAGTYEFKLWVVQRNGNATAGQNRGCYTYHPEPGASLDSSLPTCNPIDLETVVAQVTGNLTGDVTPPMFPADFSVSTAKVSDGTYRVEWPDAIDNVYVDRYIVALTADRQDYHYNQTITAYNNNATFSGITAFAGISQISHTIKIQAVDFSDNYSVEKTKTVVFPE